MYDPRASGARCDLCACGKRDIAPVAPSEASSHLRLIIVSDAPGRIDERDGALLSGRPGELLLRSVAAHGGPPRTEMHITSAALCRAETDDEQEEARACCAPRLLAELAALPSSVTVMTVGAGAAKSVLNAPGILKTRGFVWTTPSIDEGKARAAARAATRLDVGSAERGRAELKAATLAGRAGIAGRRVHPTLHPSFILKSDLWKPIFENDVRRAVNSLPATLDSDVTGHLVGGVELLGRITGKEVAYDIETGGLDFLTTSISCLGISDGISTCVLFPWNDEMAASVGDFLRGKEVAVGHNSFSADQVALAAHGVDFTGVRLGDTMLAHHTLYSHWPHNLGQVVSETGYSEPWKILAKGQGDEKGAFFSRISPSDLCKYNAQDARLTILRWKAMKAALSEERGVYEHDLRVAAVCRKMIERGISVDYNRLSEIQERLGDAIAGLDYEMRRILQWDEFTATNANVSKALYVILGLAVTRRTPTGMPATDKAVIEVLTNVEGRVGAFARALTRRRLVAKILSTYILPEDLTKGGKRKGVPLNHITGRAHYNWKQLTVTGRLNSRLQSCPRYAPVNRKTKEETPEGRVREVYAAPPGKALVYFDGSQIQMRIAAYLSGDPEFMRACEGDVHSNNAAILFPEIAAKGWFSEEGKKDVKRGKPFRDITKNCGFAIIFVAEDETVYLYLKAHGFPVEFGLVVRALSNLRSKYRHYFRWVAARHAEVEKTGILRTPIVGRLIRLGWSPKITEVSADIIQGTEADIMSTRMVEIERDHGEWMPLVAQIHDACIYEVELGRVEEAKGILARQWARPIPELRNLVIPIDLKSGERWSMFG